MKKRIKKISQTFLAMRKNRQAYLFLGPAMLATALLIFYPLVKGIWFSFTNMNQYNMGNAFLPPSYEFVGLQNYREILGGADSELYRIIRQTVLFTICSVSAHFLIGLGLALLLHQNFRGRTFFRMALLVPWAVPAFVSAFSWRWLFNSEYGFFNGVLRSMGHPGIPWLSDPFWAMVAVIATNIWLGFPFMTVTLLGGLQSIPPSLYEAAKVDGAGPWRRFFSVTLPMLKPVAFTVTLLGVIWTFNLFHVIYLVTGGGPYNSTDILPTFAYSEAFRRWEFGYAATYGVIILSILLVFSSTYSRLAKYAA